MAAIKEGKLKMKREYYRMKITLYKASKEEYFRLFITALFTQPWAQVKAGTENEWMNEWIFVHFSQ